MPEIMDWKRFPKVDLHRHLEGSLRLDSLEEIAGSSRYRGPSDGISKLKAHLYGGRESRNPESFLSVFPLIRNFFVSPEAIERLAYEAARDAALDGILHFELRFNPVALSQASGIDFDTAAASVGEGARRAEAEFPLSVRLIVSINRAEPGTAESLLRVAAEGRALGIAGIDLAGDEVNLSAEPFVGLFREATAEGLGLTAHAGEWAGSEAVRFAIEQLGVRRIGHGVRVVDDESVMDLAAEREATFEICVSSNVQTGAVEELGGHPIVEMKRRGLGLTLNTDDPGLSDLSLSGEFALANSELGFSAEDLRDFTRRAARAAFLDDADRADLLLRLERDFRARTD